MPFWSPKALKASHLLRRQLSGESPADAMNQLIAFMKRTENNAQLIERLNGVG